MDSGIDIMKPKLSNVKSRGYLRRRRLTNLVGYSFISPWMLGFILFIIGPMIASLFLSFTNYNMLSSPNWIGMDNYVKIFTDDARFLTALKVTFIFVGISVPLKLAFALFIAVLFNGNHKGQGIYRTVYYIPSIIGGSVAVAVMWRQLFGYEGAVNDVLMNFGISPKGWITDPSYALSTLIMLVIWQFGSPDAYFPGRAQANSFRII